MDLLEHKKKLKEKYKIKPEFRSRMEKLLGKRAQMNFLKYHIILVQTTLDAIH